MNDPLSGMNPNMKMFIRCIVAGDSPEQAVRMAYPLKERNVDVWAAKLMHNKRVLHAIDVLIKGKVNPQARLIELRKIIDNPETSSATKVAAIRELGTLERLTGKAADTKPTPKEDELLQEKLHILGRKAAS